MSPPRHQSLDSAVAAVLDLNPGMRQRRFALLKCGQMSLNFAEHLWRSHIDHTIVCLRRRHHGSVPGSCHEYWRSIPLKEWKHYVVRVEGWYYDFTARQFDKDADLPRILTLDELMQEWKVFSDVGDAKFILESIAAEKPVRNW